MSDDPITPHLEPGERIVWRQKAPVREMIIGQLFSIVFVVVWLGFTGTWTAVQFHDAFPEGLSGNLFGLVFVLFGAGLFCYGLYFSWPFVRDILASGETYYALTNMRVLEVKRRLSWAYEPELFQRMERLGKPAGPATILFDYGETNRRGSLGFRGRLIGIEDPAEVERLIRKTLLGAH